MLRESRQLVTGKSGVSGVSPACYEEVTGKLVPVEFELKTAWVGCEPRRAYRFSIVVTDAHEVSTIIATQMVEKVSLGDPLGMSKLSVVEVEVDAFVDDAVHCTAHCHLDVQSVAL